VRPGLLLATGTLQAIAAALGVTTQGAAAARAPSPSHPASPDASSSLHERSNKGAMGNCVTTMVHNNYSTAEKGPAPKSSNQAPSSLK